MKPDVYEVKLEQLEDLAYPSDLHMKIMSRIPYPTKRNDTVMAFILNLLKVAGISLGLGVLGTAGARFAGVMKSVPDPVVKEEAVKNESGVSGVPTKSDQQHGEQGQVKGAVDSDGQAKTPGSVKSIQTQYQESKAELQEQFKSQMRSADTSEERKEAVEERHETQTEALEVKQELKKTEASTGITPDQVNATVNPGLPKR